MEKLLGSTVIKNDGEKVPVGSFFGQVKVVGLYFSAHWCPPCRAFTPQLIEFYNKIRQKDVKLEMVFVSSDRDRAGFDEYFGEMPWLGLPYEDRDLKGKLSKQFKVQGIPSLIFLDAATGKVICKDGRSRVMDDREGSEFPWEPKPFMDIISGSLKKGASDHIPAQNALEGKVVGVYFSAHWCPPCKKFTPVLANTYKKLLGQGKQFEIVFVSSDRTEDSFNDYYATMPWLAVPFSDDRSKQLNNLFEIEGIPALILLDECGKVITTNGRAAVQADQSGEEFPWKPKPLNELTDGNAGLLNEETCLVLFTDGTADEMGKAKDTLFGIAAEYADKGDEQELFFFYGGDDEVCDSLRDFIKLEDRNPLLVILDIPGSKKYVSPETNVTVDTVKEFVKKFEANELNSVAIK